MDSRGFYGLQIEDTTFLIYFAFTIDKGSGITYFEGVD